MDKTEPIINPFEGEPMKLNQTEKAPLSDNEFKTA
jgi:hypothetical protein